MLGRDYGTLLKGIKEERSQALPWPACPGQAMHTGTHQSGPGKLQEGGQFDVGAQQCEQAQQEVHDLEGQEGYQVLLPVLEGKPSLSGCP